MFQVLSNISDSYQKFEGWFNEKFGWFFTNGMKEADSELAE